MNLNSYQKDVIKDLTDYMQALDDTNDLYEAWQSYWFDKSVTVGPGGIPDYNNDIDGVPHVCMKVPTGGGKTFMACAALKRIFDEMSVDKPKVVVWLVPSDQILGQTIKAFSGVDHPYRQRLDADFAGKVGVYTKDMLLNGQNFSPDTVREMLTVCILSYDSIRIKSKNKDERKVYQENGNLLRFAEYFKDDNVLLADTPDTALIQVLRHLSPVTIVDESHNAGSDLSIEMLNNLNPSFILDLTATPRKNSNIISYVDARKLKEEHMVKLPVVVYNRNTRQDVMRDAIQLRDNIEQQAIEEEQVGGDYIRPIVLFQAQPKIKNDSETFDKIKDKLINIGIPEEQIAIKTSNVNDLGDTDLLSKDCPIRYIITVNALKEGWDCSFAYILASLANKTSDVDVEQIVGRILRQPYAKEHKNGLLNLSYVLTCSDDFRDTLEDVVKGLNNAGFSRKDYRVGGNEGPIEESEGETFPEQKAVSNNEQTKGDEAQATSEDSFDDINTEEVKQEIDNQNEDAKTSDMVKEAAAAAEEYKEEASNTDDGFTSGEFGDRLDQVAMQPQFEAEAEQLCIPQFFIQTEPDLFGGNYALLTKEDLSEGFSLNTLNTNISFELSTGEMYSIDIQKEGEAVPKYKRVSTKESQFLRKYLASFPPHIRIKQCENAICRELNKNNRYDAREIKEYVHRIIENMREDEIEAMETSLLTYTKKIKDKIEEQENTYRENQFYKWIETGQITCRGNYRLPKVIAPTPMTDAIPYSLYDGEWDQMDGFERTVLDVIIGLGNVRWWHRIIERRGFYINAFLYHYPDFMVMTNSGILVLVESKGDHLDGSDSARKLKLGTRWGLMAGDKYRYYMVYETKALPDAYSLDEFIEIMKAL